MYIQSQYWQKSTPPNSSLISFHSFFSFFFHFFSSILAFTCTELNMQLWNLQICRHKTGHMFPTFSPCCPPPFQHLSSWLTLPPFRSNKYSNHTHFRQTQSPHLSWTNRKTKSHKRQDEFNLVKGEKKKKKESKNKNTHMNEDKSRQYKTTRENKTKRTDTRQGKKQTNKNIQEQTRQVRATQNKARRQNKTRQFNPRWTRHDKAAKD